VYICIFAYIDAISSLLLVEKKMQVVQNVSVVHHIFVNTSNVNICFLLYLTSMSMSSDKRDQNCVRKKDEKDLGDQNPSLILKKAPVSTACSQTGN
jgi:hypothetical protein